MLNDQRNQRDHIGCDLHQRNQEDGAKRPVKQNNDKARHFRRKHAAGRKAAEKMVLRSDQQQQRRCQPDGQWPGHWANKTRDNVQRRQTENQVKHGTAPQ